MEESFIALDFGSGQISAVLTTYDDQTGTCRVRHATHKQCPSVSACYILDFDKTVQAVGELLQELSEYSRLNPTVVVGLRGEFVSFRRSSGYLTLDPQQIITEKNLYTVLDEAFPKDLSEELEVVHIFPQCFILDGKQGVKPVGLSGNWLEVETFVSCALRGPLNNLNRVMAAVGHEDFEGVPSLLTLCDTLLKSEEKQARTLLLDIGWQHSSAALYQKGILEAAWELPFGDEHITQEVSEVLQNELAETKSILKNYEYGEDEVLDDVLDEAAKNFFKKLHKEFTQSLAYIKHPPQQIVLTGGGANLPLKNAAKVVLNARRVRIATHDNLIADSADLLAPGYTSALSLALYSQTHGDRPLRAQAPHKLQGLFDKVLSKLGLN